MCSLCIGAGDYDSSISRLCIARCLADCFCDSIISFMFFCPSFLLALMIFVIFAVSFLLNALACSSLAFFSIFFILESNMLTFF